ncbi:MAG TPA: malonic semialdehyde reductase [Propionibacteriaceae bacterium]|jgi:nitroreductase
MTLLTDPTADLAELDAEMSHLALSTEGQDLLFREAHTSYAYTDEPVTAEQFRDIYDLAKWAPTSMNSQPLRVVLVQSAEARDRLVPLMSGNNRDRTEAAPLVAILATDYDFHDEFHRTFPVFPGARDAFAADESARQDAATLNAGLQVGYFILGVRAAGFAAGPMTGFDAAAVSREFFPDGRHQALVVVTIGRPAVDAYRPRQPRLDFEDVVSTV